MYFGNLPVLLLLILSCVRAGNLCVRRQTINILEEEYFSNCCPRGEQDKGDTVKWYTDKEGNWTLIQRDSRIELNGTFLEFWPAVLNDTGNYTCHFSNGTHSIKNDKIWSLKVLHRNKTSCFNANHISSGIPGILGRAYMFKCSNIHHKANVVEITWYKDCIRKLEKEEELYIDQLATRDSGKYTCVKSFVHAGKRYNATHTIELRVNEDTEENTEPRLTGPDHYVIKTEIGKKEILNCTAFLGYSNTVVREPMLYWVHNGRIIEKCQDTDSPCQMEELSDQKEGKKYSLIQLYIKNIKEEDISSSYTCNFIVGSYTSNQTFTLQKETNRDLPLHVFTPGIITAILFSLVAVFVVILYVVFKVELVLLYRDITGKDETLEDGKIYDAFVSYLKDCVPICGKERKFALDILPKVLEEHFGYKLCVFERDISPGGAVVDDVQSFIDRSRRLIIILSKNYISDNVMFELETGLHKALVEKKIKVILIEYMPISDFDFLPKSLELLSSSHVVKWKEEKSHRLNSRFWKKLRYAMPAKPFSMKAPAALCGTHPSVET
ncbi:interleukin-18 receptor 1 isoform X2 [Rhineura floridana]|uniref:interleukin-18 receptor 1 isoform X2 n=1 Tax=Rhineura floridana TaxID=261503 RepID=UPI002AC7EE7F|nr:interleukin-18 receptor 1 isoform X2 [Rhineura floridana]